MIQTWLEEFTWRGRPPEGPGSEMPVAFQVTLGRQAQSTISPDKYERDLLGPLTPEQAADAGFPLESICSEINRETLDENLRLKADVAKLEAKVASLEAAVASRDEALAALVAATTAPVEPLAVPVAPE